MVATRAATDKPFDQPCAIKALTGFVEGPSIPLDGKELFFHKKLNNTFSHFPRRAESERGGQAAAVPMIASIQELKKRDDELEIENAALRRDFDTYKEAHP